MTDAAAPIPYGKYEFMICGNGSILVRRGGFEAADPCIKAAKRTYRGTKGADEVLYRINRDDARWHRIRI